MFFIIFESREFDMEQYLCIETRRYAYKLYSNWMWVWSESGPDRNVQTWFEKVGISGLPKPGPSRAWKMALSLSLSLSLFLFVTVSLSKEK